MKKHVQLAVMVALGLLCASPSQAARLRGLSGPMARAIDWNCMKGGISFIICKASQSMDVNNGAAFLTCAQGGSANGIYIGCYHRCEPRSHFAQQEAQYFWSVAGNTYKTLWNQGYLLSPCLDLEDEFNGSPNGFNAGPGNPTITLTEWANRWYNYVNSYAASSGMYFVEFNYLNYGSGYMINGNINGDSWIANPNGNGATGVSPWTSGGSPWCGGGNCWRIWQDKWNFVSQCTPSGATCENYYNGSSTSALKSDLGVRSN